MLEISLTISGLPHKRQYFTFLYSLTLPCNSISLNHNKGCNTHAYNTIGVYLQYNITCTGVKQTWANFAQVYSIVSPPTQFLPNIIDDKMSDCIQAVIITLNLKIAYNCCFQLEACKVSKTWPPSQYAQSMPQTHAHDTHKTLLKLACVIQWHACNLHAHLLWY